MLAYLLVFLLGAMMAFHHGKQNEPDQSGSNQRSGGSSSWAGWTFWGAASQQKHTRGMQSTDVVARQVSPTKADDGVYGQGNPQRPINLEQELREARTKLEHAQSEIKLLRQRRDSDIVLREQLQARLHEERRTADDRERSMQAALAETESKLRLARNDANALRAFANTESIDGETIVGLFNDVVSGLNAFVFCIFDKLEDSELQIQVTSDHARAFADADPRLAAFLAPFLEKMADGKATVETVALPAMQHLAYCFLIDYVFQPFYPIAVQFIPDQFYNSLIGLCGSVANLESQELFGRWRTMAYRAVRHPHPEDPHYLADLTEHLFDYLHALLSVLLPRQDLDDVLNEFAPRAHKVLQKAIKFQDVTQGVCVAWDYSVFFPASQQPLVPDEMEVDPEAYADHEAVLGKPGGGGVVLLPTVLGLMANRKGQQGLETNVVQKAKIVPLFPSPT